MTANVEFDETYQAILVEYASGCLNEAQSLAVAAHLALSPSARRLMAHYERIGGSLLETCCTPVAMSPAALAGVLSRLDEPAHPKPHLRSTPKSCDQISGLPPCLGRYIETVVWQSTGGVEHLQISTSCLESKAELVRIAARHRFAPPRTARMMLVIDGAIGRDRQRYVRGDLLMTTGRDIYYEAGPDEGCLALLVRDGASAWHRLAHKLRHYFYD